ncbi:DUF3429 domain-containing protein [Sphingomonas sp. AR_OL41]|jgi:hypothetical protein|uniref:DUF3429 domain-containing protein n=1 Tax=Sphingomonas sp. AR_OL41 TaxID=3042729 RepID=UPI0024800A49|nr:DUF3429 domain-containing protein [Sphingomonas sp. AR_OL41]MDH7973448.1 DUF3429 domain-containing protein [Sphingomonas sp. AR_OL41]
MPSPQPLPPIACRLGYAGLLPQLAMVAVLLQGRLDERFIALSIAYAYAALILSFLGGLWWGLAARAERPPNWLWFAAVAPSLIALASAWPWAVGEPWPVPSLILLGVALIASLAVDRALVRADIAPPGWLRLRLPLSLGLGAMTLVAALL